MEQVVDKTKDLNVQEIRASCEQLQAILHATTDEIHDLYVWG
jgi:hypothetical protein